MFHSTQIGPQSSVHSPPSDTPVRRDTPIHPHTRNRRLRQWPAPSLYQRPWVLRLLFPSRTPAATIDIPRGVIERRS